MRLVGVGILALAGCVDRGQPTNNLDSAVPIGSPTGTPDPTGDGSTVFANGDDPANAFFVSLGTNGRTCASCHDATAGWSVTPAFLAARFAQTDGLDPVFRPNDG